MEEFGGYSSEEAEIAAHPRDDDDYWRAKFVAAINRDCEQESFWGEQVRSALTKVTGSDSPVS